LVKKGGWNIINGREHALPNVIVKWQVKDNNVIDLIKLRLLDMQMNNVDLKKMFKRCVGKCKKLFGSKDIVLKPHIFSLKTS